MPYRGREARIALDGVTRSVPWRRDRVGEARAQIEAADRQLADDHLGAAIFFASRAQRTTEALRAEAQQVAEWSAQASDPRRPREPARGAVRDRQRRRGARARRRRSIPNARSGSGRSSARPTAASAGCTTPC
jgi:hypothetical protein